MKDYHLDDLAAGLTLRNLRKEAGFSQEMIGHCFYGAKVRNQGKVSLVEKGARSLSTGELIRAMEYLGVGLERFKTEFLKTRVMLASVYGEDEKTPQPEEGV